MKTNALAIIENYNFSVLLDGNMMNDLKDLIEDSEYLSIGRVKIPSGGGLAFELLEAGAHEDEAESVKEIEGVIVHSQRVNGYWADAYTGENSPPECTSTDNEVGINAKTGEICVCASCPMNQFGSGKDGHGKACKNMRKLYIMRPEDMLPIVLTLPPTAIRAYDHYKERLFLKRHGTPSGVITKITLEKKKNTTGITYSAPVFEAVGKLNGDIARAVAAFAKPLIRALSRDASTEDAAAAFAPGTPPQTDSPTEHNPPSVGGDYIEIDADMLPGLDAAK